MKDVPREHFRWAAHTGGRAIVKPKDYIAAGEIEATTPYEAWKRLSDQDSRLLPGDLLELTGSATGEMWIEKYIGFESAQWFIPELHPPPSEVTAEAPPASTRSDSAPTF